MGTLPAKSFVGTLAANIDNDKLSDKEFRQFCRNSVPNVEGIDYTPPPPDPRKFFIGGSIAVEFDEDTPDEIIDAYNIPVGDTAYVQATELHYPITDVNDFLDKVLLSCKKQ